MTNLTIPSSYSYFVWTWKQGGKELAKKHLQYLWMKAKVCRGGLLLICKRLLPEMSFCCYSNIKRMDPFTTDGVCLSYRTIFNLNLRQGRLQSTAVKFLNLVQVSWPSQGYSKVIRTHSYLLSFLLIRRYIYCESLLGGNNELHLSHTHFWSTGIFLRHNNRRRTWSPRSG